MTLKQKVEQGLKDALASRGKRKGKLKAQCPPVDTYGAAVWQAIQGHCNTYRVGIGHCLFMSDDKREVYDYINNAGNYVDLSTYGDDAEFMKIINGLL